ncbi:MAG: hypothetical protein IJF84_13465 [Thermoguttaceae bacterium]|nr:hypothetical protein [Thermoguttaceae bacterium]
MERWNEVNIDLKKLIRQYRRGGTIEDLAWFWNCSEETIRRKLKEAGESRPSIKLDPKIPGERDWILNKNNQIEEIRTCYDTPCELPEWDYNPDDEQED